MTEIVSLTGASGRQYQYHVMNVNSEWPDAPGNYVFAIRGTLLAPSFTPLYIGQSESLASRIPGHEMLNPARRAGMTHILAHVNYGGEATRKAEEEDLIKAYNPPLNTQHRTGRPYMPGATLLTGRY